MSRKRQIRDMCDSSDSDNDTDEWSEENKTKSIDPRKNSGAAKYNTKYNPSWDKIYPVKPVFCIRCSKKVQCGHQGLRDITVHCNRDSHKKNVTAANKISNISQFFTTSDETSKQVTKAKVMVTNFLVQHNLPLATADHMGPLFKAIFPDSKIASLYASGRTKTSAIINVAIGPHCHAYLVDHCKRHPFSLGIDGSNDTGVDKMNPVTIRIFDISRSKTVTSHFYDMCITSGEHGATASYIFNAVDEKFTEDSMPWLNSLSLSVDNTNSMIGRHNSVASRCIGKNPDTFISGCPCHLAHIAATEANDVFSDDISLNVEDILVDLYYWFDKSSKRKGKLSEYFDFCDQDYQQVLKHVSTRWLLLERCIDRALKKLPSLRSYFLSESFSDASLRG